MLGFWTGLERGDIWLAREQFGGAYRAAGFMITGMTAFGLGLMGRVTGKRRIRRVND